MSIDGLRQSIQGCDSGLGILQPIAVCLHRAYMAETAVLIAARWGRSQRVNGTALVYSLS